MYSELFGEDIYKVGYTSNLTNRVKDSCYTTCFYKPCNYKTVWKYNLDITTDITNAELIEKELHKALSKDKKIKNLKQADNHCNEMYQANLAVLKQLIENNLSNNIFVTSFTKVNHENIIKNETIELSFASAEYVGFAGSEIGKKCYTCRRPIKNVYRIKKDNKLYSFGIDCYKKLFEKNVIAVAEDSIKAVLEKYDLSDVYNYTDDYGLTSKTEQETELDIIYKAFTKVSEGAKTFKCTCSDEYLLYQLSKMFQVMFVVAKGPLSKKLRITQNRLEQFYNTLERLQIFNITDTDITLKKQIEQMSFIDNFFTNYNLLDSKKSDVHCEKQTNYMFNPSYESIKMSEYTKSEDAYNSCFKYNKCILSGCAGSGKTTSIFGLIDTTKATYVPSELSAYFTEPKDVLILAFTGKAVSVISDKFKDTLAKLHDIDADTKETFNYLKNMKCDIKTIDSFLINTGADGDGTEYDYVIVDEFSMVKLHQLYHIIKKCPNSNYLLMGDQNQLDPVGSPSLMKEMLLNCSNNTSYRIKYVLARRERCLRANNDGLRRLYTKLSKKDICTIESIKEYCVANKINEEVIRFTQIDELSNIIEKSEWGDIKVVTKTNEVKKKILGQIQDSLDKSSNVEETYMWKKNIYVYPHEMQKILNILSFTEKTIGKMVSANDDDTNDYTELLERVSRTDKNQLEAVTCYVKEKIKETLHRPTEKHLLFYNGQDLFYKKNKDAKRIVFDIETIRLIKDIIRNCVSSTSINSGLLYENSNVTTIHVSQGSGYHTIIVDARNPLSYNELYTATTRAENCIVYIVDIVEIVEKNDLKDKLISIARKIKCNSVLRYRNRDIKNVITRIKNVTSHGYFKQFLSKKELKLNKEEEELMVSCGLKLIP